MRTVAVIPCFNEEQTIAGIVAIAARYVDMVVVADDGSTDETSDAAYGAGAVVVRGASRQGFGRNVALGLQTALSRDSFSIVVTLDGDGQHDPSEIPLVVKPIIEDRADLVIGSRFMGEYNVPRYRKFGIDVITWLYNIGVEQKILDAQSCLRAYKRELLEDVACVEEGFGFSTEILIKARTKGYRILETPIRCIYHNDFKMNSSMNPISHGVGVALCTAKWRLRLRNSNVLRLPS